MTTTLNHPVVLKRKTYNSPRISFGAIVLEVLRTSHHLPPTAKQSKVNNPVRSAGKTRATGTRTHRHAVPRRQVPQA